MTTTHDPQSFICGSNWQLTGPLNDASGNPFDLTGATIQWKLGSVDGAENFLTLDNQDNGGVSVISATAGTILVNVLPAQSANVLPGVYRDWLRVVLSSGKVFTEWTGIVRVSAAPS